MADGVHKQHNVSAIIRTCDAVGIAGIHVVSGDDDFRRHHMVAGGSKRWVRVNVHSSTVEAFDALRESGMQIVAAHAGETAANFREIDYTLPTAIVLGSELTGPSPYATRHADRCIAIPMHGLVESLNVSVAAALILFEAERQREAAGLYLRPPPDPERFERTLFEWAHPMIAKRCRELELDYPAMTDDGDVAKNPFQ